MLASTLTKLVLRYAQISPDAKRVNALRAEAMLMMTSIIRVGQSKFVAAPIDEDSQERIMNCLQTLSQVSDSGAVTDIFLHDTKAAFANMVASEEVIGYRLMIIAGYLRSISEKSRGERSKGDQSGGYPSGRRNHIPTILQEVWHRWC